jgi:hypothetical protein
VQLLAHSAQLDIIAIRHLKTFVPLVNILEQVQPAVQIAHLDTIALQEVGHTHKMHVLQEHTRMEELVAVLVVQQDIIVLEQVHLLHKISAQQILFQQVEQEVAQDVHLELVLQGQLVVQHVLLEQMGLHVLLALNAQVDIAMELIAQHVALNQEQLLLIHVLVRSVDVVVIQLHLHALEQILFVKVTPVN